LRNIVWQVGKTGAVAPVAVFDPVLIDGVTITRATLCNPDQIVSLGVENPEARAEGNPQRIIIARANDVIPKLVCVVDRAKEKDYKFDFPTICPECGGALEKIGANLFCTSTECGIQDVKKIIYYAGRSALNIDGLGAETVAMLYELEYLSDIVGLYSLYKYKNALCDLEGFGTRKVEKILEGIEKSKKVPLSDVLHGLSIKLLGSTGSKDLAKKYPSMKLLLEASKKNDFKQELLSIKDFGEITADTVKAYLTDQDNVEKLEMLIEAGLLMEEPIKEIESSNVTGKTFVITGVLSLGRNEFKSKIESLGGKVSGSVSKNTNYLLLGDGENGSKKHLDAMALGVNIISENEFDELLGV